MKVLLENLDDCLKRGTNVLKIKLRSIACIGGIIMFWTWLSNLAYVKTYNTWRSINPIRIETAIQANEYGDRMMKKCWPSVELPDDQWPKRPYVDYRHYAMNEPIDRGDEWLVSYRISDPGVWVGGDMFIIVKKATGEIHFPPWGR